jgi:hypothetical protein
VLAELELCRDPVEQERWGPSNIRTDLFMGGGHAIPIGRERHQHG